MEDFLSYLSIVGKSGKFDALSRNFQSISARMPCDRLVHLATSKGAD